MWIGIYLGASLIVLVVLAQFTQGLGVKSIGPSAAILSDSVIADEIRAPLPYGDLNPALAQQKLTDARNLVSQALEKPLMLYKCYRSFQDSLAMLHRTDFAGYDNEAQLQFALIQEHLIKAVCDAYHRACTLQSPEESSAAFFYVTKLYPDQDSLIHRRASRQKQDADSKIKKAPGIMN
jgi:hypothetical protein